MTLPLSLRVKRWIIAALLLALAGCSALRVSYNQGPTLAWWWIDAQFDFDAAQRPAVRQAIDRWFGWHRRSQLPELADTLAGLRALAAGPVTPAQVCATWDGMQQRMLRWYERVLPEMAAPARALGAAQLDHLAAKQAKDLERLRKDFLQPDAADRRKAQLERTVERFENLYGTLSAAQKRRIGQALAASPFDPERWLDERRQRQRDQLETLRRIASEQPDDAQVLALLRALGADAVASPRLAYRAHHDEVMQSNCGFIAAIHNGIGDDQRRTVIGRLQGWEDDLRALAAAPD